MTVHEKMQIVLDLAEKALGIGEMPIAAAVFHGDTVISSAYTSEKSDKRFLVHAEMNALLDADKQMLPFDIRRELELFTNLEPCMMCLGATAGSFVGSIYYSMNAPDGAVVFARKLVEENPYDKIASFYMPEVTGGIMVEESKELWRKYLERFPDAPLREYAKTLIGG